MTNPNDIMGTNAGFGGRTSPNAFNDNLAIYSGRGVISGWNCAPDSGMTIELGGDGTTRDVAIAEDNAGNRTTINNRLATPVSITLSGAPATGNRYDLIVAYVENPASASSTDVDYAPATGIITVEGTAAATPSEPDDTAIRSAITADDTDGTTAYYVVLAKILVGQGVTTIGSGVITQGEKAGTALIGANAITADKIADNSITPAKLNTSTYGRFARDNDGGSQSYSAGVDTTALLPNALESEVGCSYASGIFTITQSGYWAITGSARAASGTSYGYVRIKINGNTICTSGGTGYATSSVNGTYNATVAWVGHLSAGDKVNLEIRSQVALTNNTARQQHLEGLCIHAD